MLQRASFRNFKALREVDIDLSERLIVLVGPNATGKTSALDGLLLVSRLVAAAAHPQTHRELSEHAQEILSGYDQPEHLITYNAQNPGTRASIHIRSTPGTLGVRIPSSGNHPMVTLSSDGQDHTLFPHHKQARDTAYQPHASITSQQHLGTVSKLTFDAKRLARDSPSALAAPRLEPDGSNLATVLQHIAIQRDGRMEQIETALARLVPHFKRIHIQPTAIHQTSTECIQVNAQHFPQHTARKIGGFAVALEFEGDGVVPASRTSEGTLVALGIITALVHDPPHTMLLDDIQRGLHPAAQQRLIASMARRG